MKTTRYLLLAGAALPALLLSMPSFAASDAVATADRPMVVAQADDGEPKRRGADRPERGGDKGDRPERGGDKADRPERGGDKPERARPERAEKAERPERAEKAERPERAQGGQDAQDDRAKAIQDKRDAAQQRVQERRDARDEKLKDRQDKRPDAQDKRDDGPDSAAERRDQRLQDLRDKRKEDAADRKDDVQDKRKDAQDDRLKDLRDKRQDQSDEAKDKRLQDLRDKRKEDAADRKDDAQDNRKDAQDKRDERLQDLRDKRQEKREDARDDKRDDARDARDDRRDRGRTADQQDRIDRLQKRIDDNRRDDKRDAKDDRIDRLRAERRERRDGDRVIITEGDRTIIREGNRTTIVRKEGERFRYGARDYREERRGDDTVRISVRPDGSEIYTYVDNDGRLLRRSRRYQGTETILIDNRPRGGGRVGAFIDLGLPPPVISIPREEYVVDADTASYGDIETAFRAPPVERVQRGYSLDEIRTNAPLRDRVRSVDLDSITFDTGSWEVRDDQIKKLENIGLAMEDAVKKDTKTIFMVEGHTDAVGSEDDNLSLSDRRAESVAETLTKYFDVPAENLTTQGYGEQYLKVKVDGPEERNRRVSIRNITPLLQTSEK